MLNLWVVNVELLKILMGYVGSMFNILFRFRIGFCNIFIKCDKLLLFNVVI